jgi:hypothetical protein
VETGRTGQLEGRGPTGLARRPGASEEHVREGAPTPKRLALVTARCVDRALLEERR